MIHILVFDQGVDVSRCHNRHVSGKYKSKIGAKYLSLSYYCSIHNNMRHSVISSYFNGRTTMPMQYSKTSINWQKNLPYYDLVNQIV